MGDIFPGNNSQFRHDSKGKDRARVGVTYHTCQAACQFKAAIEVETLSAQPAFALPFAFDPTRR